MKGTLLGTVILSGFASANMALTAQVTGLEGLAYKMGEYGLIAAVLAFVLWSQEKRLNRQESTALAREERMAERITKLEDAMIRTHEEAVEAVKDFREVLSRIPR